MMFSKRMLSVLYYIFIIYAVASEDSIIESVSPVLDSDNIETSTLPDNEDVSPDKQESHSNGPALISESGLTTASLSADIHDGTEPPTEGSDQSNTNVYVTTIKASTSTGKLSTSTESLHEGTHIESSPLHTYAVRDSKGKICILAKFHATFAIVGDQSATSEIPTNSDAQGECGDDSNSPVLRLLWDEFELSLKFSAISRDDEPDEWAMTSLELNYESSTPRFPDFDNTVPVEKKIAKSKDNELFKTKIGRSFFCPATEIINLYRSGENVANVKMKDIQLQPFDVMDGKFSKAQRCNQVVIGGSEEPFVQDETVPLAVGLTLTILTLIVVLGFSIHRAYTMRKVDYNSME